VSDVPPETPLTPPHDAVRRLLADARHTDATPPEVVARLDDALAALVAERGAQPLPSGTTGPVPPVPLASRRRRVVGIGLLAAAAVVVAGVGVGQVLPRGDDAGSADSATAGASRDASTDDGPDSDTGLERSAEGSAGAGPESLRSYAPQSGEPVLTSTDPAIADQLVQLRSQGVLFRAGADALAVPCAGPADDGGRRLAAQVDGSPGLVVFRRPVGETQRVELYTCDAPDPVRTLTVPAP
jgi:hypothetical protein